MRRNRFVLISLIGLASMAVWPLASATASPVPAPTAAKFVEIAASAALLAKVRNGGFVLYLRHGYTDNSHPDRVPTVDLNDCSTQRPLSVEGRHLAKRVGDAITKAGLPISDIHISPMCRVKDTTAAAFPGKPYLIDKLLMYTANLTDAQKAPLIANTRRLLSAPVPPGSNRLLVAHAPNLMDVMGYFPKEGTLVIFRPKGQDGFDYLGSVEPARWPELLH